MARRRTVLASLLLVLVGSAVLVGARQAGGPKPGPGYVALGDSFSAGPLIPRQRLDAGLCLRSDHNYPSLLARDLGASSFHDATCTGVRSDDLGRPVDTGLPGPPAPAPLAALTRSTDLVTLGIGGNDGGVFSSVFGHCPDLAEDDLTGSPCRAAYTDSAGHDELAARVAQVQDDVEAVLDQIHERSPRAEVWVVGYPRILPARGTCPAVPLAAGDYRWSDDLEQSLNGALAAAAASRGDHFLDAYAASRGHDACAGDEAWVNGQVESLRRAAAYHPFRAGMQALADLLVERISAEEGGAGSAVGEAG